MSRDDYISKLFIKNQDKLEQAPSADLWSKLEAELDAPTPTATPTLRPRAWLGYAAAAAVLLVLLTGSLRWMNGNPALPEEQIGQPLALHTAAPEEVAEEAEPEPYEELPRAIGKVKEPTHKGNSNNASLVIEEREEEEARQQEQRIVEAVQRRLEETSDALKEEVDDIVMNDIVLADEPTIIDMELIEPLQNSYSGPGGAGGQVPTVNFYQNNQPVAPELNYNGNSLPQISNTIDNNAEVDEVLSRSATKTTMTQIEGNKDDKIANANKATGRSLKKASSRRGSIVAKSKKVDRIKSPMAGAHPRLHPFGFLLGRWDDDHELEGRSYEIWKLKDRNSLEGRGYKLSKDAERIFEERLRIEYRNNQIFLVMSFEENNRTVDYMLTSFDQERFVFEQKGRSKFPDKVILQQNGLQGYSVTISNSVDFLTADQQRYLEHRNRVSNVRSIRTLRQTE